MKKVSIVIPACNEGPFLAQAIDTSLRQTGADVEVVVINDGAAGSTAEVAARYAGRTNFKCIEQPRLGLAGARNRGIAASAGEYLCFLDPDGYFHPEKVQKQAELLAEDMDLGFVFCDTIQVDDQGKPTADQCSVGAANRDLNGAIFGSLLLGELFPTPAVMVRRAVLEQAGSFDAALGDQTDHELWLRASAAGHQAGYLDEKLAYCRSHRVRRPPAGVGPAETATAAFRKIVRLYPEAVAAGLETLQNQGAEMDCTYRWLHEHVQRLRQQLDNLQLRHAEFQKSHADLAQRHSDLAQRHTGLEQRHAGLEGRHVALQLRYESSQRALGRATEGRRAPEWVRHFFERCLSQKLRSSIRKRLTTARNCFDEKAGGQ